MRDLTAREEEVARLIARGAAVEAIIAELGIQKTTIEAHRRRIYLKTGAKNRWQLFHYARQRGWITDPDLAC